MLCRVCGKEIVGDQSCETCGFDPGYVIGDEAEAEKLLQPMVEEHRRRFFQTVQLYLTTYAHRGDGEVLQTNREQQTLLCSAAQLLDGEVWHEELFARTEDPELTIRLQVRIDGKPENDLKLRLKNLPEAQLQRFGLRLELPAQIIAMLKNESAESESAPDSLF